MPMFNVCLQFPFWWSHQRDLTSFNRQQKGDHIYANDTHNYLLHNVTEDKARTAASWQMFQSDDVRKAVVILIWTLTDHGETVAI